MPSLPAADASAEDVRQYLFLLLAVELDIGDQSAVDILQNWRYGQGYELMTFDAKMFQELFGTEIGAIVHGRVQRALTESRTNKKNEFMPIRAIIAASAVASAVCCFLLLLRTIQQPDERSEKLEKAAALSTMNAVIWFVAYRLMKMP